MKRQSYRPEEELAGVQTFVTDKSVSGLPTGQDREKETVLPPGSATPNSPQSGGEGRQIGQPSFNVPDSDSNIAPRSLPTPGEQEGHPTKYDYGMPTRRTMEAYQARVPWRRQKEQPTFEKLKDQKYYQANKSKINQRMKKWYRSVRRNRNFQEQREDRRENPHKFERNANDTVQADMELEAYTPWSLGQKRRKQRGPARQQRKQQYRRNRAKARRQHKIWYQKNKNKPAFKRRQKMRRNNPRRFKMRPASYVPVQDICVVFGPTMQTATVDSVSADAVVFTDSEGMLYTLTPQAFLTSVVFLTPEDSNAMFEVLDTEGGDDPFGDIDDEDLNDIAALYGVPVPIVVTPQVAAEQIVEEAMAHWDTPEGASRVASRWLHEAGELGLVHVTSPMDSEGRNQWNPLRPQHVHDPSPPDVVPPNEVYFPSSSGKVIPESMKYAATIAEITAKTDGPILQKAKGVSVRLKRADPKNGFWTFKAAGSGGESYTVRLRAVVQGTMTDVQKAQVFVSCDCNFFRWQGPEHWAKTNGYLYGKPAGTASAPTEKDPRGQHRVCKHVAAAFNAAKQFRVERS